MRPAASRPVAKARSALASAPPFPFLGQGDFFNAHIERWLRSMHGKQPILFVARRQDFEAGGTRLGRWPAASVVQFRDQVAPALAPLGKQKLAAADLRRAPIAIAIDYVGAATVPPAIRKLGERR